ncbi:MAG: hypothetical protein JWP74_2990 [Marmoricola sp.]|nr:hypothetical protein [Marmoricola sp.]
MNPHTVRSVPGMIGSMIVVVLVVVGWVGFRSVTSDNQSTPIQTVDWSGWVRAGHSDGSLLLYAPTALPKGWRATSVNFNGGIDAHWHLGILTNTGKYLGIDEGRGSTSDLADQFIDPHAVRGKDVTINGTSWETWTDSRGNYAVALTSVTGPNLHDSVMIGGTEPDAQIRKFAASLTTDKVKSTA